MRHLRWILPLAVLGLALAAWLLRGQDGPPTKVLVILDTVRADHLSACGYERPTSPVLEGLVAAGAELSCEAVSPGSWTLPSHASFFTGLMPVEHGAHCITSGAKDLSGSGARARPLSEEPRTLAERMEAQGYQAHLISTNPVVSEGMGLARGFRSTQVSERWGQYFGDQLDPLVRRTLGGLEPEEPLFLVVNIADAHQPWRSVPKGLEHADAARALSYSKVSESGDWRRYIEGRMGEREAELLRERATDLYDHAVFTADANLGVVLTALEEGGWCEQGCEVVVTSDHGEFLGEHGLLDHGHYVWDENVRVPLLTLGVDAELPAGPVSALEAHDLVLGGQLTGRQVRSEAWPHIRRCARTEGAAFCDTAVALWDAAGKRVWRNGEQWLEVDGERTPLSAPSEELEALGQAARADERDDGRIDEDVLKLLRAAGYVD
jgi:arylsulfatase A-like enzyme